VQTNFHLNHIQNNKLQNKPIIEWTWNPHLVLVISTVKFEKSQTKSGQVSSGQVTWNQWFALLEGVNSQVHQIWPGSCCLFYQTTPTCSKNTNHRVYLARSRRKTDRWVQKRCLCTTFFVFVLLLLLWTLSNDESWPSNESNIYQEGWNILWLWLNYIFFKA
jgi:hypothetical protein